MKLVRALVLAALGVLVIIAGGLPWYEKVNLEKVLRDEAPSTWFFKAPFMDKPQAAMAFRWLFGDSLDSDLVETQMDRALLARPLSPDHWLLAANVKRKLGKIEEAKAFASHAQTLGSTRANILWNLAMFWIAVADQNKAISVLHDYLIAKPYHVRKVLFVAYRFMDNKPLLLEKLIPKHIDEGYEYDEDYYYARVLLTGLQIKDLNFVNFAWDKITVRGVENNPHAKIFKKYLSFLILNNERDKAFSVWNTLEPEKVSRLGVVLNNSFEQELLGYGLGWRIHNKAGVQVERSYDDSVEGNYSLKVKFSGSENIDLYWPRIYLPVEDGTHYKVSIFWKGEKITTRSNPYWEIRYKHLGADRAIGTQSQRGSWNWERVELDFEVPIGVHFVELRLRRRPTKALDKLISGTLYLDDIQLSKYN